MAVELVGVVVEFDVESALVCINTNHPSPITTLSLGVF